MCRGEGFAEVLLLDRRVRVHLGRRETAVRDLACPATAAVVVEANTDNPKNITGSSSSRLPTAAKRPSAGRPRDPLTTPGLVLIKRAQLGAVPIGLCGEPIGPDQDERRRVVARVVDDQFNVVEVGVVRRQDLAGNARRSGLTVCAGTLLLVRDSQHHTLGRCAPTAVPRRLSSNPGVRNHSPGRRAQKLHRDRVARRNRERLAVALDSVRDTHVVGEIGSACVQEPHPPTVRRRGRLRECARRRARQTDRVAAV